MKTCPQCGFHHTDADERCIRCGAYLATIGHPDPAGLPRETFTFRGGERPRWHWTLPGRLAAACRRLASRLRGLFQSEVPRDVTCRNPWAAAFLSLLPGLGQLYNHQRKKALLIFLFVSACLAAALATFYRPFSNYMLLGYLLAMAYSFNDGLVTAKKINREYLPWQHKIAFYCAWLFYVWFFCISFQWATCYFLVQFRYLPYPQLAPYLNQGERFTLEKVTRPRLGDVVFCQPPALTIEKTGGVQSDWYVVHPSSMIERIVAEPGQTFSRRDGIFYRDGRQVPPAEQPLVTPNLPANFSIACPTDSFVILFSYTFGYGFMNSETQFLDPAPKMTAPGMILTNFEQASVVKKKDVLGKPWFVYQPPPARRFLK